MKQWKRKGAHKLIYINLKIIKKHDSIIEKGFVRTKGGLFSEINSMDNFVAKEKEEILNCDGLKIVPGFVDAHCHIGMWENGLNFEGADGNEETDPVCPHLRAIDGINPADDAFRDAVKAGVTTVVTGPGSANPIGGTFAAIRTFGNCVDSMIIKQPVGMKFALGENPKAIYNEKGQFPTTRMAVAALIRENMEKAKRYLERLRLMESDPSIEVDYNMKLEAFKPLFERRMKAFFHCHRADDICTAIRIAKEFKLDLVLVHATEANKLKKKQLTGSKLIIGPLICDRLKPELKNHSIEGFVELIEAGLCVAICSDHPVVPSNYLLQTCANLAKFGVPKLEILKLITQRPAEICGIFNKVGSIEEFKRANFVAFNKEDDIFSAYVEPKFVVVDGKVVVKN